MNPHPLMALAPPPRKPPPGPFTSGPCFVTGWHFYCREFLTWRGETFQCPCDCGHAEAREDRRREAEQRP